VDLLDFPGAGSDQTGIDLVVLCPLQVELGVGAYLRRLENNHQEPVATQLGYDCLLVSAARLNADPLGAMPAQPGGQGPVAIRGVVDLQSLRTLVECHIQLAFARIDAGTDHVMLAHLRRPSL
jgi:hypothetical protein